MRATTALWMPLFSGLAGVLGACAAKPSEPPPEGSRWTELEREIRERFPDVRQVSVEEVARAVEGGEGPRPVLIDARAPEEYAVSHLPGALLAPDEASALRALEDVPPGRPVVLYCSVGWRSSDLAQRLARRGHDVANLEGSIFRWANAGHAVVRGSEEVRAVHPYDEDWGELLDRSLWAWSPERDGGGGGR